MEPADIDWKRVESRYVRDEAFENIAAPKWADLSDPNTVPVDDVAWFCRPECRHPRTAEDFLRLPPSPKGKLMRSSSEMPSLGETNAILRDATNLKRRGGIVGALMPSSPLREPLKYKTGHDKSSGDLENQDPTMPARPPASRLFGVPKGAKNAKAAVKSSAEKKLDDEREQLLQKKPQPRLKSTLSARNLFSGKDILSQISEFCSELKKLAVGDRRRAAEEEEEKMDTDQSPKNFNGSDKKSSRVAPRIDVEKHSKSSVLREVRASPPTPQRFPSPSTTRLRNAKAAMASSSSPLKRPPKSTTNAERGLLKEMDQSKEGKKQSTLKDESCNNSSAAAASEAEGSGVGVLWFLKPCTYLVE